MKKTITTFALFFTLFTFSFAELNAQNYFEDNFEAGLSKWIRGGGNWDTLSTTYSSSNHCVTDSRVGNYTFNSDPTITMSTLINLSSSTQPVLAFYHRYRLATCGYPYVHDNIYVEISSNGGFSWSQLKVWQGTNLAWTHEQFDLSNYKTNLVKIRFQLSSHNSCSAVSDGWFIDDVKIQENNTLNRTFSLPFLDNFENGLSKWFIGGFNWDTTTTNPNSGQYCVSDSKNGNYTFNSDPTITMSGVVNLANTAFPILSFFHRYSLATCGYPYVHDNIYVEISTDGGFTWIQLQNLQGSNVTWTYAQFDLSNYKTNRVKFRYKLSSHNSCNNSADGVYLDNVSIFDLIPSAINLSLTALMEGLYNPVTNQMAREEKIKVFLRNASSPYALIDSVVGYVDSQGLSGLLSFNGAPTGTYYIVLKNINNLETWSQDGGEYMVEDNSTYDYDFTTSASYGYGNNQKQIDTSPLRYGIYSGDVDQNGLIDLTDVLQINTAKNLFTTGFTVTDLNGDDLTDLTDLVIAYNNSAAFVSVKDPIVMLKP